MVMVMDILIWVIIILGLSLMFSGLIAANITNWINAHRDKMRDKQYFQNEGLLRLGLVQTMDIRNRKIKENIYW